MSGRLIRVLLVFLACGLAASLRADGTNLLPAPGGPQPGQNPATAWVLSTWNADNDPAAKGKVDGKLAIDTDGKNILTIASTESLKTLQMWWQVQGITCAGGSSYQFSVAVKGALKSGAARPTIGVYFIDPSGKWLGLQEVSDTTLTTLPGDWQKVNGKVTAPENAATMGVRAGLIYSDGDAQVAYKDPTLTLAN